MAFKDLYEHAKKLEAQGQLPQGAKTSQQIKQDAIARNIQGAGSWDAPSIPEVQIAQPSSTPTVKQPESVAPATEAKEAPTKKDAAKATMEQAVKAYDDYIKSDEHKQRLQEAENKAKLDAAAQATFGPGTNVSLTPQTIRDEKAEQLRAARDQAEADYNRSLDEEVMAADQAAIADLTDEERSMLEQYAVNRIGDQNRTLEMQGIMPTAQQQAAALIQKYGQQRVDELAESLMRQQNADLATQVEEESRQFADEHGFLGSVLTVPVAAMSGLAGTLGHLQGAARSTGRYQTLDANEIGTLGDVFTGTVRGQVQQNIEGEDPNLLRKAASVGYQGVMSIADSIARGYLGGGAIGAGVLAATSTFSQVMSEASRNGATPAQAAALATVNSAIEAATEAIPLDELIKTAKGQGAGTVLKNVLRNAGIEATAEELSLVGTFLAEAAIMQEQSGYQQEVRDLILGGMSPEAARETASRNLLNEAVNTALVAGLSGGMSSVGASVADAKNIPTPPTIEQVADMMLGDLVKPKQVQNAAPVETAPEASGGTLNGEELLSAMGLDKIINSGGTVTNSMAEQILRDPEVLDIILQETATQLVGSRAAQRAQIKNAVYQLAGVQPESDTAPVQQPAAQQAPVQQTPAQQIPQQQTQAPTNTRQQKNAVYAELQHAVAAQKDLQKKIDKAEAKVASGKGSAAYLAQLKAQMEQQTKRVDQLRSQNDYFGGDYDTTVEKAAQTQQAVFEQARQEAIDAKNAFNEGRISQAQYDAAQQKYNTAGQELFRLKNMTQEQYAEELASVGLVADRQPEGVTPTKAVPAQQQEAPQVAQQPEAVQPQAQTPQQQTPAQTPAATQESRAPQMDTPMGRNKKSTEGAQPQKSVAARRNFSGMAAYEDMLEEGNTQKPRPGAVRDVEIPKTDSDGRRVTEFASNVVSAAVTPDPVADAVKSLVGDKQLSFDTRTNQQSLNNAADDIRARGADTVRTEIAQHAAEGVVKDGDIEKGMVLYAEYANDPKKQDAASGLIVDMAKLANMSGRNLQLFSLMKRMTPEGQLMTIKKNVNRYIEDINKNRSKRKQIQNGDTLVDEDLAKAFTDAKTDSERKAALDEIYKDVASKIKPTLGEMYDAWRNLAMLGNVKTHERNIFSTAAFQPYVEVKRAIGAALEKAAGVEQEKRTKAGLIGKEASALLKWAKQDAQTDSVLDLMDFSGTTGNEARSAIQDNRKILPGFIDKAAKKNMEIMEKSDMFFKKNEYARSLASFLKARGYTAEDLQNGTVPRGVLDDGRQMAVKEAQKATFNDSNKFSDAVVKLGKPKARDGWAIVNVFKKGILPFLRTPANVVVRAAEYNPLAGVKTLLTAKKDIESGRKSTAEILDQVSASLTGTIATAVGMLLGSGMVPGIELVGAIEDEEELREGAQEYSLKIGDNYYGVGWLAPAMVPLFLGANLVRNGVLKTDENADAWDIAMAVVNLGVDTIEPILDLSMLSSLNDTIDKFANEDDPGDKVMAALLNTATSYLQQGLPTIFGHLEQATEAEKSATFVNTDNKLEKAVKTTIANATKRIPGVDLYQTKKLDEFGQPVKNESDPLKRAIDALFNPSTKTTVKDDPLTKEIVRLNRKGFDVSPNTAPKVVVYQDKKGEIHNDVRLTEEQYQTLARTQGDTEKRILEKVINNDVFKTMTDAQKADTLRAVYDYARQTGMKAVFDDYDGMDTWAKDLTPENELKAIMNRQIASTFTKAFDGLTDDYKRGNDTAQSLKELEQAYQNYKALYYDDSQEFKKSASGRVKYYIEARNLKVSPETFSDMYNTYREIDAKDMPAADKAQEWAYNLEKAVDRGILTEAQKDNLKQNMQYRYSFAAETEKFDEMIEDGVRTDAADQAVKVVKNVKGTGTDGAVRDIDKRGAIADLKGVSDAEKDAIMKAYMTDYDPNAKSPQKTELKYDYARQELGLTPREYVDVYTVQLDGGKKAQKLDKWEYMGYTPEQAKMFYRLFSATGRTKIDVEEWYRSILQ